MTKQKRSKKMKGFERKGQILFIRPHELPVEAFNLLRKSRGGLNHGYNKYHSEFEPCSSRENYSHTLTQPQLEEYWQTQTTTNDFVGTLEEFIEDYRLQFDKWLIDCGYDFKGIKEIILDM